MADLKLAVVLWLTDRLSAPLRGVSERLGRLGEQAGQIGRAGMVAGAALMAAMVKPIQAFADAEDAAMRLKVAMMGIGGVVDPSFGAINRLATDLGNRLPGTTADFQNMMAVLKENGTASAAILQGVGEATAYLAVQLKMAPDEAARFAARLSQSVGIAGTDMMAFMDIIARTKNLGVDPTEMAYAFGRSSGKLKQMGQQGLDPARKLAPIFATLIPSLGGETVGTGFASILSGFETFRDEGSKAAIGARRLLKRKGISLDLFDSKDRFSGVENMVRQLDKLRTLKPKELTEVLKGITSGGQDAQMLATIIMQGLKGYEETAKRLEAQATLLEKVNAILGTLRNLWEAATGTFTNTLAAFASTVEPELKALATWFGTLSQQVQDFIALHPQLSKMAAEIALFGGPALLAGGGLLAALGTAAKLLGWLTGSGKGGAKGGGGAGGLGGTGVVPVWVTNKVFSPVDLPGGGGRGAPVGGAAAGGKGGVGLLGGALGMVGAGVVGYEIGSAFYERVRGSGLGDSLGEGIARVLSFFGSKSADEALKSEPNQIGWDGMWGQIKAWADRVANPPIPTIDQSRLDAGPDALWSRAGMQEAAGQQSQAAATQATAAEQHAQAAQTQQAAARTMQGAAASLAGGISGTITVRVIGPAQVTGVTASGPVEITAGDMGEAMTLP